MASTRRCPKGFIRRKGYTRKNTGKYVKSACIRSTSTHQRSNTNSSSGKKHYLRMTRKRCPKGEIARAGFVRKISSQVQKQGYLKRTAKGRTIRIFPKSRRVYVDPTCVKDMGKPGKLPEGAPTIGTLKKGELSKYGYSYKLSESERKYALQKAVKEYGALGVYRKLNAVSKYTANMPESKASHIVFTGDRNWIRRTYSNSQGVLRAF